jgi:hypothetical protein
MSDVNKNARRATPPGLTFARPATIGRVYFLRL